MQKKYSTWARACRARLLHFSYFEGNDWVAVRVYRPMEKKGTDWRRGRHNESHANTSPFQTTIINGNPSLRIWENILVYFCIFFLNKTYLKI